MKYRSKASGDSGEVQITIASNLKSVTEASLRAEIVSVAGQVRASGERTISVRPGKQDLVVLLNRTALKEDDRSSLWDRLRYELRYTVDQSEVQLDGSVALGRITPDLFDLYVTKLRRLVAGSPYAVRIRAQHPLSAKPTSGVTIKAKLELADGVILERQTKTDRGGNAFLSFDVPRDLAAENGELTVTGVRGHLQQQVSSDVEFASGRIIVTTDKPIYQPGQELHIRGLVISPDGRASPAKDVIVMVEDQENNTVFRQQVTSSRFGIVRADWKIPQNQLLGNYSIALHVEPEDSYWAGAAFVKLSRYELPNFVVQVKADKGYYVPGEKARVEIRGDYLFGKPVKRGVVRLVREKSRYWNYDEQRYEVEEEDEYRGKLDANDRFLATVDLSREHAELDDGSSYRQFRDLSFAAYLNDESTGRTEQRRFDLRITRNPIHVYLIPDAPLERDDYQEQNFYISAQFADGSPCQCQVNVSRSAQIISHDYRLRTSLLRTVQTNKYGLAKVTGLKFQDEDEDETELSLRLEADDGKGNVGSRDQELNSTDSEIRVSTDKALYLPGEPIKVEIQTSEERGPLVVQAESHNKIVWSEMVGVRRGRASLAVPYSSEMRDEVVIAAYELGRSRNGRYMWGMSHGGRTVLYPRKHGLKVDVRLDKAIYKPGEEAEANFRVSAVRGGKAEGALGIGIVDVAVEARARTDEQFSRGHNFWPQYGGYWFFYDSIAGITRSDLDNVDLTEPIPAEMDLLAEVLLSTNSEQFRFDIDTSENTEAAAQAFRRIIQPELDAVMAALKQEAEKTGEYVHDQQTLARALRAHNIEWSAVRDPWGNNYRAEFASVSQHDRLSLTSGGPDETFGTDDDFEALSASWPYFGAQGKLIDRAVSEYHERTGSFIRDAVTLKAELSRLGLEFDKLRDRWGQAYINNFRVNGRFYTIQVASGGPNGSYGVAGGDYDDFVVWTANADYLVELERRICEAIAGYHSTHFNFPENESDLDQALSPTGLRLTDESMRDHWRNPYYAIFSNAARYGDRVLITQRSDDDGQRIDSRPVTRWLKYVHIRSRGPDGVKNTLDDFDLGHYSAIIFEQSASDASPQRIGRRITLAGSRGGIVGTVVDPLGAVVAGVTVTVQSNSSQSQPATAQTDTYGEFIVANLPAGVYSLRADMSGFKATRVSNIQVVEGNLTQVNITLSLAATSEVVTVEGGAPMLNTETASLKASSVSSLPQNARLEGLSELASMTLAPKSTPRLREYFPETMLWEPELVTDRRGRSRLKFKVADSITSWKLAVVASDASGELGSSEKQFTAFQPFFVDHDPPPVLTQNDEISLPVVVRNYLNKSQTVDLEIKPEAWFSLLGQSRKSLEVAATDSARAVFPFRAVASVAEGKQRVTAIGHHANDAIERKTSVHPDGEELTLVEAKVFSEKVRFDLNIPAYAIPGSSQTELRIYPNLHSQLIEAVEAILERPYGCAEQTISSAYPSLMALRAYQQAGVTDTADTRRALRYLQAGYDRLLSYQAGGGFSYWGRGEPDFALTAYALRFLTDARPFIAVKQEVVLAARSWLFKRQQSNGAWGHPGGLQGQHDPWRQASVTAYVTRVLAMSGGQEKDKTAGLMEAQNLRKALGFLRQRVQESGEPYVLANYALAAWALGEKAAATEATARLFKLAHQSNSTLYWQLEQNTPFYGWGQAGRLETTAVVLFAVAEITGKSLTDPVIQAGVRFLMANKDRYGIWHSGQATVSVLEALIATLAAESSGTSTATSLVLNVNGNVVRSIPLPAPKELSAAITVSLSDVILPGANTVELAHSGSAPTTTQVVSTFYVPWTHSEAGTGTKQVPGDSDRLQLGVRFDKTKAAIGEQVRCTVETQRIGFRGYGMMLAEIGLPPGAEVDRSSLESAVTNSGWTLNHYDILPDRIIAYIWPSYSGSATQFSFTFRPRFGLNAQTAPSVVYDYYNPEARAVLKPVTFTVQ